MNTPAHIKTTKPESKTNWLVGPKNAVFDNLLNFITLWFIFLLLIHQDIKKKTVMAAKIQTSTLIVYKYLVPSKPQYISSLSSKSVQITAVLELNKEFRCPLPLHLLTVLPEKTGHCIHIFDQLYKQFLGFSSAVLQYFFDLGFSYVKPSNID